MFANGQEDRGLIPGRLTKDSKMVLDTSLINTQHCKLGIKGKMKQSIERSSALSNTSA